MWQSDMLICCWITFSLSLLRTLAMHFNYAHFRVRCGRVRQLPQDQTVNHKLAARATQRSHKARRRRGGEGTAKLGGGSTLRLTGAKVNYGQSVKPKSNQVQQTFEPRLTQLALEPFSSGDRA